MPAGRHRFRDVCDDRVMDKKIVTKEVKGSLLARCRKLLLRFADIRPAIVYGKVADGVVGCYPAGRHAAEDVGHTAKALHAGREGQGDERRG